MSALDSITLRILCLPLEIIILSSAQESNLDSVVIAPYELLLQPINNHPLRTIGRFAGIEIKYDFSQVFAIEKSSECIVLHDPLNALDILF